MTHIEERVQAFDLQSDTKKRKAELFLSDLLSGWAQRQPPSPLGFLDLAAGLGIEAKMLADKGFSVIAQDPSEVMVAGNHHTNAKVGKAERLEYSDNSFSGLILKDAFMFLSPIQRKAMFKEALRTLVPGGSLFILSEKTDAHRARYLPNDSKFSQTLPSTDFESYEAWLKAAQELEKDNSIFAIEYMCSPTELVAQAEEAGFTVVQSEVYDRKHPLSLENRWLTNPGFIMELRK
jgi:ubiquinone/menaquinone biosynthesis C-methylase UbiE